MFPAAAAKMLSTRAGTTSSPYKVAIIGGGIAGCATARRLAQVDPAAQITLYEIGRGPGGRASTRKSRSLPQLRINHGAPYAEISTLQGRAVISSLGPSCTVPFDGVRGSLHARTGRFQPHEESEASNFKGEYITGVQGDMAQISASLLENADVSASIDTQYQTMVWGLVRTARGAWQLQDQDQNVLGTADWLVVAGSGVAHPRWSNTFAGEPPLIAAEQHAPDPKLRTTLDVIAQQQVSPVLAVFFACSGSAARQWLARNYNVVEVTNSSILSRLVIQGNEKRGVSKDDDGGDDEDAWCSVVLHSTEEFARQNSGVYGRSSSAARVGQAVSDASIEDRLIATMLAAVHDIPDMPEPVSSSSSSSYEYGPVLHRWGNAFPKGTALPDELAFLPSSRVAFCGDYVASSSSSPGTSDAPRMGSFESALLSGTAAGENIARFQQEKQ